MFQDNPTNPVITASADKVLSPVKNIIKSIWDDSPIQGNTI